MSVAYKTSVLAVATTIALSACSFGPSGTPPAMSSPEHYDTQPQPSESVEAAGVAQHFDVGATAEPQWWRYYRSDALNALVEDGLCNSPTLAAAEKTLAAAQQELRGQIHSSMLPSIDGNAAVERARSPVIPGTNASNPRYNVFVGQVQAQYTFDLFGAVRYNNAASAARVNVQKYELEAARRALAANIVDTVINAAALDRQIELTERLVTVANDRAHDDEQRYALGAVSHAQALASKQNAASLAASLPELYQQRASAVHALAVLIGRTPDRAPVVPDLDTLSLPEHVPVVVPSELLRTRPDILAAEATVHASAAEVGAATAQLFPSLSLTASMGRAGFDWPALLSGAGGLWAIGASMSQPIFHGGALLAHRRASIDAYDASVLQYKSTVLSAFENVADSLAALENDAQALASTDAAAQAARIAYDETAARSRTGALPLSAEQSSEQQYLNAQLEAVSVASRRMSDTAALFQAMGEPPVDQDRAAHS